MSHRGMAAFALATAIAGLSADTISFTADKVSSVLAKGKEQTSLNGHAIVKSERIHITADSIEISGKDYSTLICKGNVVADDQKNGIHLTAPRLTYDRSSSLALLQGPSVLVDDDNHVVLKADWIQDDGENGVTLAQINVRILKENLACRSDYVIYRRKEHSLELSGGPRVVKNGDEYRATRMVVNTDTEEIRLEGTVSGTIHSTEAGKETQASGTGAATGPGMQIPGVSSGAVTAESIRALRSSAAKATLPVRAAPPPVPGRLLSQ